MSAEPTWIDFAQLIGIALGFGLTIRELRVTSKLRKFDVFWRIGESHREVWREVTDNSSLNRVLLEEVNLEETPLTLQEEVFVNLVVLHMENVFHAHKHGYYSIGLHETADIRTFIQLPVPSAAWSTIRKFQAPDFVAFLEEKVDEHRQPVTIRQHGPRPVEAMLKPVCTKGIEFLSYVLRKLNRSENNKSNKQE